MFLHIGNNKTIRTKDIIGIFDLDNATVSSVTRKYLASADEAGLVESATVDIPKSFILFSGGEKKKKICFSQLSTSALVGRVGKPYDSEA